MSGGGSTICHGCGFSDAGAEPGQRCPRDGLAFVPVAAHKARPDDAFLGRVIAGKYPIVGFVGAGTQGAVYKAIQEPVGREVVIKLIRAGTLDTDEAAAEAVRERFVREAKIVARLSNPSTVTLHDYGVDVDGTLYMVLEYVRGKPLSRVLAQDHWFQPGRAVALMYQVLQSLAEAHALGLVHRDLKPANIMVMKGPFGEELIRVLDFGVARAESRELTGGRHATKAGTLIGTPRYMSPEQARGEVVEARSDIYAAGIILYELLCGSPPFGGDDPMEALLGHLEREVPPIPPEFEAPPALEAIIRKAMAKDPNQRYANAQEMARALMDARAQKESRPSGVATALRAAELNKEPSITGAAVATMPVSRPVMAPGLGKRPSTKVPVPAEPVAAPEAPAGPPPIAPQAGAAEIASTVPSMRASNPEAKAAEAPVWTREPAPQQAPLQLTTPAGPEAEPVEEPPAEEEAGGEEEEAPEGRSPFFFAGIGVSVAVGLLAATWFAVLRPQTAVAPPPSVNDIPDPVREPRTPKGMIPAEPSKPEPAKVDPPKPEPAKPEPAKVDPPKAEPAKPEPAKIDPPKPEPAKPEPVKADPPKPEPAKPEPAKPEPVKVDPPKPAPTTGFLDVTCTPGCNVYVDGQTRGAAPLKGLALPPGKHLIWVKDPASGNKDQRVVEVRAGQRLRESFEF